MRHLILLVFIACAPTVSFAVPVPPGACAVRLLPPSVIREGVHDFIGDVALALARKIDPATEAPNPYRTTHELMLRAFAGGLLVQMKEEMTAPFQFAVSYSIEGGRVRAEVRGLEVSVETAAELTAGTLKGERQFVRNPFHLRPQLIEAWVSALAEAHLVMEYNAGRIGAERINAWDTEATGERWRGGPAASPEIAARLWPAVERAHDTGSTEPVLLAYGLDHGARVGGAVESLPPLSALSYMNDLIRSDLHSALAHQREAMLLVGIEEGDYRPAFLQLGERAANIFVLEKLAENAALRTPKLKELLQTARTQYDEAYQRLARKLSKREGAGKIQIYPARKEILPN